MSAPLDDKAPASRLQRPAASRSKPWRELGAFAAAGLAALFDAFVRRPSKSAVRKDDREPRSETPADPPLRRL